jgi:hypothetical protein
MNTKTIIFLWCLLTASSTGHLFSQGVSINEDAAVPDPSAMLDIKSTNKGLLIPRMNFSEMFSITSPAEGLMIYCTSFNSFYYYNGTAWEKIGSGEDSGWTMDGNDLYSNNTGMIGIGTTGFLPSHKLNIENNSGINVLRLIGPGSWGQYARLNFGDDNYVYIDEFEDDQMMIYASGQIRLESNNNIITASNYGALMFNAPYSGVGINLPDNPTAALDIDGQVRIRDGNPDAYKILTASDNAGNTSWQPNRTLEYPDGQFPLTPVTHTSTAGPYVVPPGKNLYITNWFMPTGGNLIINGLQISGGYNNYSAYMPGKGVIIAGQYQSVQFSGFGTFNGFLATASVQPITTNSTYTVPAGQTLVITSLFGFGSSRALSVDGIVVYDGYGNFTTSGSNFEAPNRPVFAGPGSTVSYNGGSINGYLIAQ